MEQFFINIFGVYFHTILAQLSGLIAVGILLYGLSQKDDIRSIKIVTISMIFWTLNYVLLGLVTAILATVIAFIRMYFSLRFKGDLKAFSFLLFLTLGVGYSSYDGNIVSSLPIIASVIGIVGFQICSGIQMRLLLLGSSFLWLGYSIEVDNIAGIINEVLVELVMIFTILRMYLGEENKITLRQKVRILISQKTGKMRPRIDFGRFLIFRDRKRYLDDDFVAVYEGDEKVFQSRS